MLTDYHTHLRPDVARHPAGAVLHGGNVRSYLERPRSAGSRSSGFSEHVYRFREASTIWRHAFWRACALDSLDEYVEFWSMKAAACP